MTSQAALTGRLGNMVVGADTVARLTQWSVNPTLASSSEWGDSDGAGFTNAAAGRKGATSETEGKYDTGSEVFDLFQPEDIVQETLWLDNLSLYWAAQASTMRLVNSWVSVSFEALILKNFQRLLASLTM